MKPLIIDKKSWHWRVVSVYGYSHPTNSCDYLASIIWGFLMILIAIFFGTIMSWLLLLPIVTYFIYTIVALLSDMYLVSPDDSLIVSGISWIILFGPAFYETFKAKRGLNRDEEENVQKPTKFQKLLLNWKNKICFPLVLSDD